jgi:hypothetical protein
LKNVCGSGGLLDKDSIGLLDTDTITADEGPYIFKPHKQQEQQVPLIWMKHFFNKTGMLWFTFQDGASLFMDIKVLGWTKTALNVTYWWSFYSYILCSIIGAFEVAYNDWIGAKEREEMHVN